MSDLYEQQEASKLSELSKILTPEILEVIREAARIYGWTMDYTEVSRFVEWGYELKNIPIDHPDLEPYRYDEPLEDQPLFGVIHEKRPVTGA